MTDREKVIKGLECCKETGWTSCHTCPYYRGDIDACIPKIKSDALALLKAQEPQVLTLEEYKALAEKPKEERDPVWEEWTGLKSTWAIPNQAYGGYGTSWRCWTSRPTDAQRQAVKWE